MSKGLHLELDKKPIPGSTFSQGVLTLQKAGEFTVQIKEYLELQKKISKLDPAKGKTLVDPAREKENEDIKALSKKFETLNWAWNTVYSLQNSGYTKNLFVKKGFPFAGKTFTFPKVLEGGGYCYVEAFFEGEHPIGKVPNGLLVRAIGTPKVIRIEWTDMQYNPIKDKKVAFGSHLLLHVYTEGLYGQEILVGLKDVNGLNKDNSSFFEREVKTYPVKPFEDKQGGVSGSLLKADDNEPAINVQKVEIEVGIDHAWVFAGNELEIETSVIQKSTQEDLKIEEDDTILNVSMNEGEKYSYTQEVTNMPVVVGEIDTIAKLPKEKIDFTFGVFLDGTLNNMYDTEVRQLAEGKSRGDVTGLGVKPGKAREIFAANGDKDYEESSYENDLSNPAILFKNYTDEDTEKIFKIYVAGIGTNSAPKEQGKVLGNDDYKKNDVMQGPAFGMGSAGIMDRVKEGIEDVVKMIKAQNLQTDKECVGTITFDVFGFSRGAAAARHFVHVVTHGPYVAKKSLTFYSNGLGPAVNMMTKDLQNNMISEEYADKVMPQFGVLGQLLTEAKLMDEALTKVNVRFVGIYDTVPHHGLFQDNDIKDLGLDNVSRAKYVVHMIAADEYRANFSLVDISSVAKVSPYDGDRGGMELIYPGVHCDVGGAYVDGGGNHPYRINLAMTEDKLTEEKKEFVNQGWFKEEELSIEFISRGIHNYRLEGYKKKVSNQYSYIPLHFMANFCELRSVPIKESDIINISKYTFTSNFIDKIPNVKHKNVKFLEAMKDKLWEYTFRGGKAVTFENSPEDIRFLRYNYLHWNATYGDPHESVGTWLSGKNKPNMDSDGKRKRHVR